MLYETECLFDEETRRLLRCVMLKIENTFRGTSPPILYPNRTRPWRGISPVRQPHCATQHHGSAHRRASPGRVREPESSTSACAASRHVGRLVHTLLGVTEMNLLCNPAQARRSTRFPTFYSSIAAGQPRCRIGGRHIRVAMQGSWSARGNTRRLKNFFCRGCVRCTCWPTAAGPARQSGCSDLWAADPASKAKHHLQVS
jgi:hypothetical protein